jgi:hypothetical protein
VGFELAISATEWPQTQALDGAATGIGHIKICRTVILPVALYGNEAWLLKLRKEHRLRVFKNGVLRKICKLGRDEVRGEWRRPHTGELYDLSSSLYIIPVIKSRTMRWAGHVARTGERRGAHRVLVGRPEGKTLRTPGCKWKDNIKMDIQEVSGEA